MLIFLLPTRSDFKFILRSIFFRFVSLAEWFYLVVGVVPLILAVKSDCLSFWCVYRSCPETQLVFLRVLIVCRQLKTSYCQFVYLVAPFLQRFEFSILTVFSEYNFLTFELSSSSWATIPLRRILLHQLTGWWINHDLYRNWAAEVPPSALALLVYSN